MTDFIATMHAKHKLAAAMLEGVALWSAYVQAESSTPAERKAYAAWSNWRDLNADGDALDPINRAVTELANQIDYTASRLLHDRAVKAHHEAWVKRPGDQAAVMAEEEGIDYATALRLCNMD